MRIFSAQMQELAHDTKPNRFRTLLFQRGITANGLARATGLSASLIEKLRAGVRAPSPETAQKIEDSIGVRIWSAPSAYRQRAHTEQLKSTICSVIAAEGVDESAALQIAAARFPSLFPSRPTNTRKTARSI